MAGIALVHGIGGDMVAALACGAAAAGLLLSRVRRGVSLGLILGIAYHLSARRLAGTLAADAIVYAPVIAAALFIWWPQLVMMRRTDDG